MINGLTAKNGQVSLSSKPEFKGKISTGFAPGEGSNKTNYPKAAGFFRMMRKTIRKERLKNSQRMVDKTVWVENKDIQNAIDSKSNGTPRILKCISFAAEPEQMWHSNLMMFNGKNEIVCTSCGEGCIADFYKQQDGQRVKVDRECKYKECPDYKSGACKENGMMVVWPEADMDPLTPYKFTTRSINTIIAIETMLYRLYQQIKFAHIVACQKNPDNPPVFMGLNGMRFILKHEEAVSGGRNVWVTKLLPSKQTQQLIRDVNLEIIKEGGQGLLSRVMVESKKLVYDAEFSEIPMVDIDSEALLEGEIGIETGVTIPEEVKVEEVRQPKQSVDASEIMDE